MARFWAATLSLVFVAGGVLQMLRPPATHSTPPSVVSAKPPPHAEVPPAKVPLAEVPPGAPVPAEAKLRDAIGFAALLNRPGRTTPGPIADPDPAMLEPYSAAPNLQLPRIAGDGRTPMGAYAAGFDPSSRRPRVALLIAGIGTNEADSLAAIKNLPGAVTLAVSPYAGDISRLLAVARMTEHEYLLSVPMEPQGYPVSDPDDRYALMTSLPPLENLSRLRGILARVAGYAGITNALGQMRGERLSGVTDQLDSVLQEAENRGLYFLDARTGQKLLTHVWNRSADLVLDDDPVDAATLDQRLNELTHLALDKGSALGIVAVPRALTLERVAAWTNTLALKGVALTPVSALVLAPAKQDPEK